MSNQNQKDFGLLNSTVVNQFIFASNPSLCCELDNMRCSKTYKRIFDIQISQKRLKKLSSLSNNQPTKKRKYNYKSVLCPICQKPFFKKGNLKVHMRTHSGETPFQCKICAKSFKSIGNMRDHTRRHLQNKYEI